MPTLDHYLTALVAKKATALHLSAGKRPMLRVDGNIVPIQGENLVDDLALRGLLKAAIGADRWDRFVDERDGDFSLSVGTHGRFTGNVAITDAGVSAVFAPIEHAPQSLDQLGLPPLARAFLEASAGLVLVCGPHGSGKSTTIAALVDHLNATRRGHLMTLESPLRVVHRHQRSLVSQREIGSRAGAFASAIHAATRQDVDVLALSELSDRDSVNAALDAASQGVLVLAEAHTPNAATAIQGLLSAFTEETRASAHSEVSEHLVGIIGQVLCRAKDGRRIAAYEVLANSDALAPLIEAGRHDAIHDLLGKPHPSVHSLDDSLAALVGSGALIGREAQRRARDKQRFGQHPSAG